MPSKIPGGAPGPWQPTVRTPLLPSENAIFRTAVPFVLVPSSMLSTKPTLAWALAGCQLTRPVTLYAPLPPEVVVQVPPPSAADEPPPLAGATKCPDPVSVITSPPGAVAESWPPGLSGPGGIPVVLMMSQRTCSAPPDDAAEANVVRSISAAATVTTPPTTQNRLLRRMLSPSNQWMLICPSMTRSIGRSKKNGVWSVRCSVPTPGPPAVTSTWNVAADLPWLPVWNMPTPSKLAESELMVPLVT